MMSLLIGAPRSLISIVPLAFSVAMFPSLFIITSFFRAVKLCEGDTVLHGKTFGRNQKGLEKGVACGIMVTGEGIKLRMDTPRPEIIEQAKAELKKEELLERTRTCPFWHCCEVCGKKEWITAEQAAEAGWIYPPQVGKFGEIGPRVCGDCSPGDSLLFNLARSAGLFDLLPNGMTSNQRLIWESVFLNPNVLRRYADSLDLPQDVKEKWELIYSAPIFLRFYITVQRLRSSEESSEGIKPEGIKILERRIKTHEESEKLLSDLDPDTLTPEDRITWERIKHEPESLFEEEPESE